MELPNFDLAEFDLKKALEIDPNNRFVFYIYYKVNIMLEEDKGKTCQVKFNWHFGYFFVSK